MVYRDMSGNEVRPYDVTVDPHDVLHCEVAFPCGDGLGCNAITQREIDENRAFFGDELRKLPEDHYATMLVVAHDERWFGSQPEVVAFVRELLDKVTAKI